MLNIFRIGIIYLTFSLLIICPTSSFAWSGHGGGHGGHGGYGGHWGGYGRHGGYGYYGTGYWGSNFGYNLSYWPDGFDYYNGVLVSPSVVETPTIVTTPTYQTTIPQAANSDDNEFTINAPNASGGYTSVVLKRSGNGFVGPQGEYYSQFPRVSQLSLMYGKT